MAFYKSIAHLPDDSQLNEGDQLIHTGWIWQYRSGKWHGLYSAASDDIGIDIHLLVYRGVSVAMSLPKVVSDLIIDPNNVHDEDIGLWSMMYPELLQEYKELWVMEYSKQTAPAVFDKYKEF